jgi:hypothetical protein
MADKFDGIKKLGPTFQAFVNPDIVAEGAVENRAQQFYMDIACTNWLGCKAC